MKECTKCKEVKELTEFSNNKKSKDGLRSDCKSCRSLIMKAYHVKNREANNTRQSEHIKSNKDWNELDFESWLINNKPSTQK